MPAAAIPAAEFIGIDEAVFLTGGSQAASGFCATLMSFVSVGREVEDLMTTVGCAAEGRFVGWLDVVLTTLSRACAEVNPGKHTVATKALADRKSIFLKTVKL